GNIGFSVSFSVSLSPLPFHFPLHTRAGSCDRSDVNLERQAEERVSLLAFSKPPAQTRIGSDGQLHMAFPLGALLMLEAVVWAAAGSVCQRVRGRGGQSSCHLPPSERMGKPQ
ncbi:hypothetical protein JOQ06_014244, partial [Pogonophryne albipinna]